MYRIYITDVIPKEGTDLLKKKGFDVSVNVSRKMLTDLDLKDIFSKHDAVISLIHNKIDESVIGAASPALKVIANFAVGYDNIDVVAAARRGIIVTNTPGVAGESVAEHTFLLILAVIKKLIEADRYVRSGKFSGWDPNIFLSSQVFGKTIGIVGLGKIGNYVGHIAFGGFKMKILYHDICRFEDFEMLTEAKFVGVEKLLKEADIVTLHVPLSRETNHLIGKKELGMMKNTAILINTSRGAVVDQEVLIDVLSKNKIAGAGLDVYEDEHHIPHELRVLGNTVLTPHIASATFETRIAMAKIAAQNVIDVFEGKEPAGLVKVS
ncbi:MAG: D-glycerate dehydrogenase [Candidatus Curtissbacteria bacterium]|nr:D-glycerate dehydrogenase [Candidatus Curtissbacteria bacterium]